MDRQPKPAARSGPRRAARSGLRTPADAAADVDRVIEAYVTEVILEESPSDPEGMYWWWPRAAWVDPNQLIVDTESGGLVRVPYTTNDQQEISFAAPVEVLEQFVDLSPTAKAHVLVAARQDTQPRSAMRVFESRDEVPGLPQREPAAGVGDGGNNVGMTPEQLKALGLAEDATPEQIDARIAELAALENADGGDGGEGSGSEGGEAGSEGSGSEGAEGEAPAEGAEGAEAAPPAASGPRPGMVEVPAEAWETVQANAAAGAAVATQNEETRRDTTIAQACQDGKIAPSAKQSMENLHARDQQAFYNLLTATVDKGGLAKNLVPVTQQGGAGRDQDAQASATVSPDEMARMFPEVATAGRPV